jgi:CheY-like chemotaxis protein
MPNAVTPLRPIEILLVEDSPTDAFLIQGAFRHSKFFDNIHVIENGIDAMDFLRRTGRYSQEPRPDFILLDLNLPMKDGREVLEEIKTDHDLRPIPVIVFTSSEADEDIQNCYDLHANCYITKPVEFDRLVEVLRSVREFWSNVATLPREKPTEPIPVLQSSPLGAPPALPGRQ